MEIEKIAKILKLPSTEISEITVLKKGMTNHSFLFLCKNVKYIIRVPGEGTTQLIDRYQEDAAYKAISGRGICDAPIYLDPKEGYKITRYLNNVRNCDPHNVSDLRKCMAKLREFHAMKLRTDYEFDIYQQINFYESLWEGKPSAYRDYHIVKEKVWELREYIKLHIEEKVLAHIDAVPDNFLFCKDQDGNEQLQLIDWEYAGMQDPHVDIAMFCIYSMYCKKEVDQLIDIYFENCCDDRIRAKIYCYIASCGLLWSNWCEYKKSLGVEFGEYALKQYQFAKDYYEYAMKLIGCMDRENRDV